MLFTHHRCAFAGAVTLVLLGAALPPQALLGAGLHPPVAVPLVLAAHLVRRHAAVARRAPAARLVAARGSRVLAVAIAAVEVGPELAPVLLGTVPRARAVGPADVGLPVTL